MKKGQKEGRECRIKMKTHDSLREREREQKSLNFNHKYLIASIGSGTVLWWVCVQNTFETLRFSKTQGGKQSREWWEWGVSDKRKKEARAWKREGEREMWITHCCSDPSMCPSLSQPDPLPGLQGIYVCVWDWQRKTVHWSASVAQACFRAHSCAFCVCVSSPSRGESTWDEGHMRLNTHVIIKQSPGRGFS